ncbi:MAG: hypothetical protein FJY54_14845 [Betaproteobacteria bacterium]|nr:hypothetical protein [Betaproteobacteria bacterium]
MARILCVWELGGNIGHVASLAVLAKALTARGHDVICALRSLQHADQFLGHEGLRFVQAPLMRGDSTGSREAPLNYADILERSGFCDRPALTTAVKAWRELYRLAAPDAILFAHAPAALLAARGTEAYRAIFGVGFCSPPRTVPLPSMRPWLNVPRERLLQSEQRVVDTMNQVLLETGGSGLENLRDLLSVEQDFLCTFSELDHYEGRSAGTYWGPMVPEEHGAEVSWPRSEAARIYGYVRANTPNLETVLAQLRETDHGYCWFIPGIREELVKKLQGERFRFVQRPLTLEQIVTQCHLAITNGGHGTTASLLLGGVPLYMFPRHLEQFLVARNVTRLGAGQIAESATEAPDYAAAVRQMIEEKQYTSSAQQFAARYRDFSPGRQIASMVDRLISAADGFSGRATQRTGTG